MMLRSFFTCFLVFFASNVCLQRPAAAEDDKPYAIIFGTVYDGNNHPLYGVKVKIRRADQKKAKWELYSDHHGEFAQRVPPKEQDYLVWIDAKSTKGSKAIEPEQVKVHINGEERKDISLHLIE